MGGIGVGWWGGGAEGVGRLLSGTGFSLWVTKKFWSPTEVWARSTACTEGHTGLSTLEGLILGCVILALLKGPLQPCTQETEAGEPPGTALPGSVARCCLQIKMGRAGCREVVQHMAQSVSRGG